LYQRGIGPKTQRWTELSDTQTRSFENEELILRNTYLNSQAGPFVDLSTTSTADKKFALRWRDETIVSNKPNVPPRLLWEENRDEEDLVNLYNPPKIMQHYQRNQSQLTSILKGSTKNQ